MAIFEGAVLANKEHNTFFYIFGELENQGKKGIHLEGIKGKTK